MNRASVAAGVLLGFFLAHWLVAHVRAEVLVAEAREWGWTSYQAAQFDEVPVDQVLKPVPPNDAPMPAEQLWDHLTPAEQLNGSVFAGARSVTELNEIRLALRREANNERQILTGPVPPVVGFMVAAITDPVVLLVGALAGWWFFSTGSGVLRAPVAGVAAGAAGNGLAELILQLGQYTRSTEMTIAVEVFAVGVLIIAMSANWLVSRYAGGCVSCLIRPSLVITRGTWALMCKGWRALEAQGDEAARR